MSYDLGSSCCMSAATVRAKTTGWNARRSLVSVSGSSGLWGSLSASRNFSSLCFTMSSNSELKVPSANDILRLR